MDLSLLICQTETPLTAIPSPSAAIASWWPFCMAVLALFVSAGAAAFAAWVKFREKQIDHDQEADSRRLNLEVEELKLQFELRKHFHEQLTSQIQDQLAEGRLLREELTKARVEIWDRDKVIAELRGSMVTMQAQIGKLEREVAELERFRTINGS